MRLARSVTVATGALLLLAGCGPSSARTATPTTLSAVDALSAAAAKTVAAKSSLFALSSSTVVSGQTVTFTGTGAFDYVRHIGKMTFNLPTALTAGKSSSIEERVIGDSVYMQLPTQPGLFYRLSLTQIGATSLGSGADPSTGLAVLTGASHVTAVGHEAVRGVSTTHYAGTYDVAAALAKATGTIKALLTHTLAQSNLKAVPFDAYVDDQGRMRRMVQHLSVTSPATGSQPITSVTSLDFYDFGTAVDVVAPPAAQVKDGSPLAALLTGKALHG